MRAEDIIIETYKKTNKITHVMIETGYSYDKIKRTLIKNNMFEIRGVGGVKRKYDLYIECKNFIENRK